MKLVKSLAVAIGVMAIGLSACKKDDPEPAPSMVGFWQGKYGATENYPTNGYAFLFRSDGTVRVFNGVDTASAAVGRGEGIYSILGSTVTAKYTYLSEGGATFSISGTVNAPFTFLEGTWGSGDNTSGNGRFFIVKQ